jgi:hypothetical protein
MLADAGALTAGMQAIAKRARKGRAPSTDRPALDPAIA